MAYWWVNHKQTHRQEIDGGYIWSPTAKKNGAYNQSYENLKLVRPGDVVFSYADSHIRAIGRAAAGYSDAAKPQEFGSAGDAWDQAGWLVPIEWESLFRPLRPKDHLAQIAPLLPSKHSPIRAANGDGVQSCYLAGISDQLGALLMALAGRDPEEDRDAVIDAEEQRQEDRVRQSNIPDTDKQQIIKARRGQGLFKYRVTQVESACRLTGISDVGYLVASHIKPWRAGSNVERLDGHNGLLLAPHVDRLFDRGDISFADDGSLLVRDKGTAAIMKAWGLPVSGSFGPFSDSQRSYLAYHREHIFSTRPSPTD